MIYFFGNRELNFVKIGYTSQPIIRYKTIDAHTPFKLTMFKIIEGTKEQEKNLHKNLSKYRIKLEWYSMKAYRLCHERNIHKLLNQ